MTSSQLARAARLVDTDLRDLHQELTPKIQARNKAALDPKRPGPRASLKASLEASLKTGDPSSGAPAGLVLPVSSPRDPAVSVVSGHTGAGVQALWKRLLDSAAAVSVKDGVPVHTSSRR